MICLTTEQAQQIEEALEPVHGLSGINMSNPLSTIRAARAQEQAEQEPVLRYAHIKCPVCDVENPGIHKCASPVSTKDLTDDEIDEIFAEYGTIPNTKAVRAVIAADREKNNANNNS